MGACISTSNNAFDPQTGQRKKKKQFGGAYPGQRRPVQAPYIPDESQFTKVDSNTRVATQHFVSYGGGNALVLANNPPPVAQPLNPPGTGKENVSVTIPEGVEPGETIHVAAPDGRRIAVIVPAGMRVGSTFTVEFASGSPPYQYYAPPAPKPHYDIPVATAVPSF
mmetsp:Transcript_15400/g.22684  ORF Transcript_15400/g.22684 Transcript_15400/m.22684 type:complete len:166 (-) Transcript_15400:27-524(-)